MDLKIIEEKENPLFNRKEIVATIKSDTSPRKEEITKILSEKYSVPINALRILNIKGKFGIKDFQIRASIYPSDKEKNNVERLTKKEKAQEAKFSEIKKEESTEPIEESKTPAEKEIGLNPVEEAKKLEEKRAEEDKKEKNKSKEEKLNE